MEFVYIIDEESQKVTITGIKDCPCNLNIPSTIIHTDNKEYVVESVHFGKIMGRKDYDGLICESISFSSTISSIKIHRNATIKELILPNNIVEIEKAAFIGCEKLEKVVFPDNLEIINDFAFSFCKSLKEAIIPNSVKKIGNYAFKNCVSLTIVKLSDTLTELGFAAFEGCSNLQSISTPNTLEWISNGAFKDCVSLSDVQMHNNQHFTHTSFIGCVSLKSLGEDFVVEEGFLFNKEKTEMYTWLGTKEQSLVDFVVPNTVKLLGNGFSECKGIRSIDLSLTKITEVYDDTFTKCQDLQKVILPEGIKIIGDHAFSGCSTLTTITIPNTVTNIGSWAFDGCLALTNIIIPNSVKAIGIKAFYNCPCIKNVRISIGYKEKIDKLFENNEDINIDYIQRNTPRYYAPRTGAYTHGQLRPCPYCGSNDVRTYCDGTAECESCGGEYTYWK